MAWSTLGQTWSTLVKLGQLWLNLVKPPQTLGGVLGVASWGHFETTGPY